MLLSCQYTNSIVRIVKKRVKSLSGRMTGKGQNVLIAVRRGWRNNFRHLYQRVQAAGVPSRVLHHVKALAPAADNQW